MKIEAWRLAHSLMLAGFAIGALYSITELTPGLDQALILGICVLGAIYAFSQTISRKNINT